MPSVKNEVPTPECPYCASEMALRKGARGDFWGCRKFPMCKGTRNIGEETKEIDVNNGYDPIVKMPGSHEQEAIWEYMLYPKKKHLVINAGPGTGKTWTSIQYTLRAPKMKRVAFVAFNRHIAQEANGKLRASRIFNVEAKTYHGLGKMILEQHFKSLSRDPDDGKMQKILEDICPMPMDNKAIWRRRLNYAETLCGHVKNYLVDFRKGSVGFADRMYEIADHHALEIPKDFETILAELVIPALEECIFQKDVRADFDDYLWLPNILDLRAKYPYDELIADECQDLNLPQHELTFRAVKDTGRIAVVGDRHQAIYGFRGAATDSIERLTDRLGATKTGVDQFPLTITRRCPKLHVMLAQTLYPEIQALDDAPDGSIESMPLQQALALMKPGDMAICRINKPLITTAYGLIKRGVRPHIKGRDIGEGLLNLIDRLQKALPTVPDEVTKSPMGKMHELLKIYRRTEEEKLLPLGEKAAGRLSNLADKCDCLATFITNSMSIAEMRDQIDRLFSNEPTPGNAVTLGTVHRTKGLEAERVFVLLPELIGVFGTLAWEHEQEKNLAWIAATRAKFTKDDPSSGALIFCGGIPKIYTPEEQPKEKKPFEGESCG